jgi:surface antigen
MGWASGFGAIPLRRSLIVAALALGLPLAGCETKAQTGALVGAVTGAVLGVGTALLIGDAKSGVALGALIGAGVGTLVGGTIGEELDENERLQVLTAARTAAEGETGTQVAWQSQTHAQVHGSATPIAPQYYSEDTVCRRIREVVFTPEGEATQETNLCRKNGQWQPA